MLGYRYGGNEHLKKGDWGYKTVPDYGYFKGSVIYPKQELRFSKQLFHGWIEDGFLSREMGGSDFIKIKSELISPYILNFLTSERGANYFGDK